MDQPLTFLYSSLSFLGKHQSPILKVTFYLLYLAYLSYAIYRHVDLDLDFLWCDGLGFVIIITGLTVLTMVLSRITVPKSITEPLARTIETWTSKKVVQICLYLLAVASCVIFLVVDSIGDSSRLVSISGIVFLLLAGTIFSKHPRHINWRQVTWGIYIQFLLALAILRWDFGRQVLNCLADKVGQFLFYSGAGGIFLYDYLLGRQPFVLAFVNDTSKYSQDTIQFAADVNAAHAVPAITIVTAISVVAYFSFIIGILMHLGALQGFTGVAGRWLEVTIGTTKCESANAIANIFIGTILAPMTVLPYIKVLTMSELHACMASGFASIASNVFALYVSFGVDASQLLAASLMSAPAALSCAKLLYPEMEESRVRDLAEPPPTDNNSPATKRDAKGVMDAAIKGAIDAGGLISNLTGVVCAVVAFVGFLNGMTLFFTDLVGLVDVNLDWFVGKIFMPLAFIMGVQWDECEIVGRLLAMKLILSLTVAYRELGILNQTGQLSKRTVAIATFVLCGDSNPGTMGITLAVFTSICPGRREDVAKLLFRSLVSGVMACLLTACFAGALIPSEID